MMKHIILIGFMGCGKSSVGYRLSYKLRKCLIDTDRLIEQREGMTIAEIFEQKGEAYFRQKETDCLKSLEKELGSRIVSVGGGTPIREENREILKASGTVVYLKAFPETIYSRVKHDTRRPLLQCEDPMSRIETMLAERDPIYESVADIVIEVDGKHIKQVVQEVAEAVQNENLGN